MIKVESRSLDLVGAFNSTLCAIHCMVVAFLPGWMALLGLGALADGEAEWGVTILSVLVASVALRSGFRHHRSRLAAALFVIGIIGLLAGRVWEESAEHHVHDELAPAHTHEPSAAAPILGIAAGCMIVLGHLASLRASREARWLTPRAQSRSSSW